MRQIFRRTPETHNIMWDLRMPLLRVSVINQRLHVPDPDAFHAALAVLPPGAPIIILIHGYRYAPSAPARDPHRLILSLRPRRGSWRTLSWPRHLGFGRGDPNEGLCIALGWEGRGSLWRAWRNAGQAGEALADLVMRVQQFRRRPVQVVAHSLGARVALAMLPLVPAGCVGRMVLMAAAEFQSRATAAMSTPAGRTCEVLNITSRENDLFDQALEWLIPTCSTGDRALGAGLWPGAENWLDLQADCAVTRAALGDLGHRIPAPRVRICHWWAYLRPGLMRFYGALLRTPERHSLAQLRAALPHRQGPRWSRLFRAPRRIARHLPRPQVCAPQVWFGQFGQGLARKPGAPH